MTKADVGVLVCKRESVLDSDGLSSSEYAGLEMTFHRTSEQSYVKMNLTQSDVLVGAVISDEFMNWKLY